MDRLSCSNKSLLVSRWKRTTLIAASVMFGVAATSLQAQQLGYKVAPTVTHITWDDAFPLTDHQTYGGHLSILFGSQLELQPYFMRGTGFGVDSARGTSVFGPRSAKRSLRFDQMGANLQINLGNADVVPFARVGGGLLKFTPDSGETTRRLSIAGGAGLRWNLGGISGEVSAEQFRFRMIPGRLFGADTTPLVAGAKAPILRNMGYSASVNIPLSAVSQSDQSTGLRGVRAPLEPFVGRLTFVKKMGLAEQDFVGVRTGLDFGPQVGLRGFFMRGVNRDHDKLDQIASYGGEAQFTLSDGRGIKPYVVAGAGRIEFLKDHLDLAGKTRDDETALIIGGGASFSLSDRVQANVAIRDFVMTLADELSTTRDPDELLHNRMLSAGFTFSVGGSAGTSREERRVAEREVAMRERQARDVRENQELQGERNRNARTVVRAADGDKQVIVLRDSVRHAGMQMMAPDGSGRMITLPVPTVGEIIIRYGPLSGNTSMREHREIVIDTLRVTRGVDTVRVETTRVDTVRRVPPANNEQDDARMQALERQLAETRQELDQVRRSRANETVRADVNRSSNTTRNDGQPGFFSRLLDTRPSNVTPFVGLSTGDGTQLVVSGRANLGPLSPGSRLDLVPELSLTVGDGRTTLMGMANARLAIGGPKSVQPYVMLGAGLSTNKLFVLGTSVGLSANLRGNGRAPLYGFAEVQGINFFNQTRFLIGLSVHR